MSVASDVAQRSGCARAQVGAVIVDSQNRIVATGYNGPPAGYGGTCLKSCPRAKAGVLSADYTDCIAIHAEANALMFCDRRDREGGTIYVNGAICYTCAKLVANSGLERVVMVVNDTDGHRPIEKTMKMLKESGLCVHVI